MYVEVNFLAVVLAAVAGFAIGFVWYMPQAFGEMWCRLSGVSKKDMDKAKKEGMLKQMVAAFVGLLVSAWVLAQVLALTGMKDMVSALQLAGTLWLGTVAVALLSSVLWERKPLQVYLINAGHWLVVMLAMAAVLTYM